LQPIPSRLKQGIDFYGGDLRSHKNYMRMLAILTGAMAVSGAIADLTGDPVKAAPIVAKTCASCHGSDGNSQEPRYPKLAGQCAGYIHKQLQDFKSKKRQSEIMDPIVAQLSADDIANLAVYFASKESAPGVVREKGLLENGKNLFDDGNPASGVPACSGCHGRSGEGSGLYPRLAGQHTEYTINELKLFAASKRTNDRKLMQTVAERLTEQEIKAVAEYIQSLR